MNVKPLLPSIAVAALLFAGCGGAPESGSGGAPTDTKPAAGERWTAERANAWYAERPWLVGTNFNPSSAINQLEVWQEETFDIETIEKELELSASIGMNTHRVFLHDLLWEQDAEGFVSRIDQFLAAADRHGIETMLVLFDGVWDPNPELGPQREPVPHRHNSGWVQSPGAEALKDRSQYPRLERYVKGVIGRFKDDDRVLAWDLFNEPENTNDAAYGSVELEDKAERAFDLLRETFAWAREVNPSQPLTAGVWGDFIGPDGRQPEALDDISRFMLDQSDLISFHTYETPDVAPRQIAFLQSYGRPILCTEYLARSRDNTFENLLPLFKEHKVGAYNWGFVAGKTNTLYPWDSWDREYTGEPELWHHEIFRTDYTPYREAEVELIRSLTGADQGGEEGS
jgi:hypothetical protein